MKRNFKSLLVFASLLSLLSCGKYGYDFADGYQDGDKDPSAIETDTTMYVADKSLYHRARIFPGLVGDNVGRIKDTTITINMNYANVTANDLKVSVVPRPVFSTGLYAPAGENIKIIVPAGIIGLTVQVGVHTNNLSSMDPRRRDPLIFTRKELFPGINYVKNLYGGTIWIITNNSRPTPVSLKFDGAVKSPDFILGESNVTDWLAEVEATAVPWIEVRSKRVVFSIPRAMVLNHRAEASRVELALTEWNEIYEKDFYDWMGLDPNTTDVKNRYPDLAERGVLEIQLPDGVAAHSGYPWMAQLNKHWFFMFVDRDYILNPNNLEEVSWGAFHEVGHNYQQGGTWSWNGLGETTNNLFIWKAAHRLQRLAIANHPAIRGAFDDGLVYTQKAGTKNIITDSETSTGNHPFVKILLFLQIFDQAKGKNGESGWDFMPYLYRNARNTDFSFALDEAKRDFFYRNLCDFTGKDWQRFCKAWGVQISALARREMSAKYSPIDKTYWTYDPLTKTGGNDVLPSKYDLEREDWTVTASSEATGEGALGGAAKFLLDGNLQSFWMSNTANEPPHQLTFTLTSPEEMKGFYIIARQAGANIPARIKIQASTDGITYTTLTDADLKPGTTLLSSPLPTGAENRVKRVEFVLKQSKFYKSFRYIFEGMNQNNSHFVGVAEAGAFYDVN
ncbi:F5/8 type C domain-containing protein [Sphingobacterium nematocida]|uniref:F5/8 type C domain-containing protein n=1 Tax=Sphingobacterium nematocida TaxID=1513896 RepID=A0A1T5GGV9_9SPHI|nr:M60 family metallopeptidase [Sphingobacterium nematocida]SKC07672.1 F5/8 type C domain-containing protein [Sphingobacterium nematocida]